MKKIIAILLCIALAMPLVLTSCHITDLFGGMQQTTENTTPVENPPQNTPVETDEERYNRAITLLNEGKIEDAYAIFLTIRDYADVEEYLSRFSYKYTTEISTIFQSDTDISSVSTTVYNQYGNPLLDVSYYTDSENTYTYYFEYDENQNLISKISQYDGHEYVTLYQYDENNRPIWRSASEGISKIEYDAQGNVVKRQDSYGAIYEYEYDSNNNTTKTTYTDEYGKTRYVETFAYDAKGQLIKETYERNDSDSFGIVTTYTYDENGNLLVEESVQSNGYKNRDEYEYDAHGNLLKKTCYTHWSTIIYTWEYNKAGKEIVERSSRPDGSLSSVLIRTYDDAGNLIKTAYQHSELGDDVRETFYEYDEHGNLLKITTQNGSTEYAGYKLYYNPYSNLSVDFLDSFIGK